MPPWQNCNAALQFCVTMAYYLVSTLKLRQAVAILTEHLYKAHFLFFNKNVDHFTKINNLEGLKQAKAKFVPLFTQKAKPKKNKP
jgi:hypothetical protein